MATETLDLIRDLSCSEHGGVVVELRRLALISGLTSASVEAVNEALDALSLTAQSSLPDHTNLILMQRAVRIIDQSHAEVELTYRHFAENEFQDLTNPPNSEMVFQMDAALAAKTSQKDKDGASVILGYTYSTSSTAEPSAYRSRVCTQGGEVPVRVPTKTLRLVGTIDDNSPDSIVGGILGYVNSTAWKNGAARTWLCTEAKYTPWNFEDGKRVHRYWFTFEYNVDTWDPQCVYIHDATGRPVSDWATNAGSGGNAAFKVVKYAEETDFELYFRDIGLINQ